MSEDLKKIQQEEAERSMMRLYDALDDVGKRHAFNILVKGDVDDLTLLANRIVEYQLQYPENYGGN